MTAKIGVSALVGGLVGASEAAMPYKEEGIGVRFGGEVSVGCSEG